MRFAAVGEMRKIRHGGERRHPRPREAGAGVQSNTHGPAPRIAFHCAPCVRGSGPTSHRSRGACWLALQQRTRRRGYIFFAHQRLADEKREDAAALETQAIVVAEDAALADDDAVLRNALRQSLADLERDFERVKIAVVDADEP